MNAPDTTSACRGQLPPARLLTINQVAGPLMRELLEDLCRFGVDCKLLAGWVDLASDQPPPFEVLPAATLAKSPTWRRLWTWGRFTLDALHRMLCARGTPVLIVTNPPLPMLLAPLARRLAGVRYVLLIYDIYPDVAERMGMIQPGGRLARLWRGLSRRAMLDADGVITLGRHMAETLREHLRPSDVVEITVLPNWADTDVIRPLAKSANPFARQHGLTDKFVVTYSGAFGATHDTESIFAAAEMVRDLPDVHFLLIGGGTRQAQVERLAAEKRLSNLSLLPFQPFGVVPYSLAASDCLIVCLDEGYEGVSVPSKTYYALAAGSAVLGVSAPATELADLLAETGCGIHVPPRRPDALADAVRRLHDDPDLLSRCKAASRQAAEGHFSRTRATRRYFEHLRERFGWDSPPAPAAP